MLFGLALVGKSPNNFEKFAPFAFLEVAEIADMRNYSGTIRRLFGAY